MKPNPSSFIQQRFSVDFDYKLHFTEGLFELDNELFCEVLDQGNNTLKPKVFFVVDRGIVQQNPAYVGEIEAFAKANQERFVHCGEVLVIEGGEAAKNSLSTVEQVLQATDIHGIDRHSFIVAIGGGAVLDAVGFATAIAHRGIRHIRVPSTVLSQNDGGVGVKNGINYFGKKNYLGSFAPPFAVIDDFRLLDTLDARDWRAGMSEAVKVALLKDAAFFDFLEQKGEALSQREDKAMQWLVRRCAELHLEHIASGDPFELGSSRPLDFGHWAAHKLEQLSDYEIRHGEAVAIGIALDVCYSQLSGRLEAEDCSRVLSALEGLGFALWTEELTVRTEGRLAILAGLDEFREHLGGQLTIMLLEEIGRGVEVHEMEEKWVEEALEMLHSRQKS